MVNLRKKIQAAMLYFFIQKYKKKYAKLRQFFVDQYYIEDGTSKQHRNYLKEVFREVKLVNSNTLGLRCKNSNFILIFLSNSFYFFYCATFPVKNFRPFPGSFLIYHTKTFKRWWKCANQGNKKLVLALKESLRIMRDKTSLNRNIRSTPLYLLFLDDNVDEEYE